jgi:hypothetical protein
MNITNRSPRLLSIAAPGQGLGILMLVPLDRVEVPPELEQAVRAALAGPLRPFVAKGELAIEDAPTAATPELVGDTAIGIAGPVALSDCVHPPPTAAELEPRRVVTLEVSPELEPEPTDETEPAAELEPPPAPAASRAKRR